VNISQGSKREGDAFHIVKKSGKEYHVYGSGDDKTWVEVGAKKKTDTKSTDAATGSSGTTSGDASSTDSASGSSASADATTKTTGKPVL
jgi:hypothetical protein